MLYSVITTPEVVKLPQLRSSMAVDRTKPLPTSLQSDFIPEDILFALTQPPPARDKLGPPTRYRNLNTSLVRWVTCTMGRVMCKSKKQYK